MTMITIQRSIDFDQLKQIMLEGEQPNTPFSGAYDSVIELFENRAFRENPYQYILEDLLDNYIPHLCIQRFNETKLIKNLPNFDNNASLSLLEQIAQKRFKKEPQYEKIMSIFKHSLYFDEFVMRFEFGKRHLRVDHLAFAIQNLFGNALHLKGYSIDENYICQTLYEIME